MCPTGTSHHDGATSVFRRAFTVMDADHDGKISSDDLRSFYASVPSSAVSGEDEMITAMINVADANRDGFVQYDEFEGVLKNASRNKLGNEIKRGGGGGGGGDGGVMEEVFKVMDKDGDGRLGVEDLRSYLNWAGIRVDDDEIKGMIKFGGGDVSNGVSFDAFLNIFGS